MRGPKDEVVPLTGLRGIAALLVVAHHAEVLSGSRSSPFFRGQNWVDLFFVLSGYVLALAYLTDAKIDFRKFYVARFSRIYPLHIVAAVAMVFAACGLALLHHQPLPARLNPIEALRELTLTMALPVVGTIDIWNSPAWSISVEWWVYLSVFPLLAIFGRRLGGKTWLCIGMAAMAVLAIYLLSLQSEARFTRGWPAYLRGVAGFAAGYGVRRLEAESGLSRRVRPWLLDGLSLIALATIYLIPPLIGGRDAWPVMLLFPLIIFGCLDTDSVTTRFLSWKPIHYLGNISYSIYLIHELVILIWRAVAVPLHIGGPVIAVPVCMAVSIALSAVSYRVIELPARNYFRRVLSPAKPKPRAEVVPVIPS
jgi:peptidoglycan/LPS O-acetylase OafA/YrhL